MAATPPLQLLESPRTPPTPLHGAAYDHEDSPRRTSARLRQKRALEDDILPQTYSQVSRAARTPKSPRTTNFEPPSPNRTPQRKPSSRRVQVMSPQSPDSDAFASKSSTSRVQNNHLFSQHTTMNEGMLPTPVKTPNKKQKIINKSNIAARALFQDQIANEEMAPSPRKQRKTKRFNGFSLENGEGRGVAIFTDSRDQIPEVDQDEENPFLDDERRGATTTKVTGTSKRRKVTQPKKLDPQVEQALEDDEGMVYVFRGKKVYRRFDDAGDEEEEIDEADLGLLQHTPGGGRNIKPLKTLTRKSIRPTRLFQTEVQKRARELEKEEEAATDVEESVQNTSGPNNLSFTYNQSDEPIVGKGKGKVTKPHDSTNEKTSSKTNGKKTSPFDSWVRIKPGSASSSSGTRQTRGRKRAASEDLDGSPVRL